MGILSHPLGVQTIDSLRHTYLELGVPGLFGHDFQIKLFHWAACWSMTDKEFSPYWLFGCGGVGFLDNTVAFYFFLFSLRAAYLEYSLWYFFRYALYMQMSRTIKCFYLRENDSHCSVYKYMKNKIEFIGTQTDTDSNVNWYIAIKTVPVFSTMSWT